MTRTSPRAPARLAEDGGRAALICRRLTEKFRTSLFGVPVLWLIGAIIGSQLVTQLDRRLSEDDLPAFLDTTVASARAILGAVSSGTIAAASVVFSLTLVAIQMSSSVYSSRVLRNFLRDRFQQHMIGSVTATFLYSLLVLREVRGPLEEEAVSYIPRISVFLAVIFAVGAVLALLASISHTAQKLRVSTVTRDLYEEVADLIAKRFAERDSDDDSAARIAVGDAAFHDDPRAWSPDGEESTTVTAARPGWVQQISIEALTAELPPRTTISIDAPVGSFIMEGAPLARVWLEHGGGSTSEDTPEALTHDDLSNGIRSAFEVGDERTMHQDVAFGLLMLEDVAVKALSPGVNDPNTARAVIHRLGAAILTILERDLPPGRFATDDYEIWAPAEPGYRDYVELAFDQIRLYSMDQGPVQLALVTTLVAVRRELHRRGAATEEAVAAIDASIDAVIEDMAGADGHNGSYHERATTLAAKST